jgi:hypothetical protein
MVTPLMHSFAQWEKHILLSLSIKPFQPILGIYMDLNATPLVPTVFFKYCKYGVILQEALLRIEELQLQNLVLSEINGNPPEAKMTEKLQNCTNKH